MNFVSDKALHSGVGRQSGELLIRAVNMAAIKRKYVYLGKEIYDTLSRESDNWGEESLSCHALLRCNRRWTNRWY